MLHSLCIKTNNKNSLNYLLKKLESSNFLYSENKFKIYNNIIVHGDNESNFHDTIADYITDCIIDCYEKTLIKKTINTNYFYFSDSEKIDIYNYTIKDLKEARIQTAGTIFMAVLSYILENKSILLDGFIDFRLKDYLSLIDDSVDIAVDNFLIQREYYEFVNLLKVYIDSKISTIPLIHLLYIGGDVILIDEFGTPIEIDETSLNAKYLSDITFSRNDYVLNTLLTLLPKKIVIHLIDKKDEFINTIELIFDKRIKICTNCNLCNSYKNIEIKK